MRLYLVTLACTALLALAPPRLSGEGLALVYDGPVADADGVQALVLLAEEAGLTVSHFSDFRKLPALLANAAIVMVGGTEDDLTPVIRELLPQVREALAAFLRRGGAYLGICGGAYLACAGWEDADGFVRALGLADVEGDSFMEDADPRVISVDWKGRPREIYYQYGPRFLPGESKPPLKVLARYADGTIAAFWLAVGKGRVLLCGPHPEAAESWLEDYDGGKIERAASWKPTDDLAREMLKETLGR